MEENIGIYRQYIADISCIGRRRHGISRRKIGGPIFHKKSPINRRFPQIIACGRRKLPINRRYFGDKIADFLEIFRSSLQRDLTTQITLALIQQPRCDSNVNNVIQRPDLSQFVIQRPDLNFNDKLVFQRLFWPKFLL